MKISHIALSLVLSCVSLSAIAGPVATALGECLADNTTGKERKEMARWAFIAIASHPDMKDISTVSPAAREAADKQTAILVTRLLTEACVVQFKAAMAERGNALQTSFATLGGVAMRELMSEPSVNSATQDFTRFLDAKKFEAVMQAK
jgi:hypothetical protein